MLWLVSISYLTAQCTVMDHLLRGRNILRSDVLTYFLHVSSNILLTLIFQNVFLVHTSLVFPHSIC